jgi:penicillin-binding protein 1A
MANSASQKSQNKTYAPRGCAGIFVALMLVLAAAWGAGLGVMVFILEGSGGTMEALENFRPKIGSKVYSADGVLLGEFAVEARQVVSLNEIPVLLQKAFLATEDHTFYTHKGIRPLALANVAFGVLRGQSPRGASTITQQIIRNIESTGISKEVTIQRKVREMMFALQVEREFTKDEILELYLNQIFLGVSAYGVEAASHQYFSHGVDELTLGECAVLAGLTRAPNRNNPFYYPENARTRRDIVLAQMLRNEFITQEEHDAAVLEDMDESVVLRNERAALADGGEDVWQPGKFLAPYFAEAVRLFIGNPPPPYEISGSAEDLHVEGLEITTTIDMRLQREAEEIVAAAREAFDAQKLAYLKKRNREAEFKPVVAALVCLDNRTGMEGFVRAMVAGADFEKKKFNMVTQALRQPGSSVKPFVWLTAIDRGMTGSSIIVDEPITRYDALNRPWSPKNFDGEYHGPTPLRKGLEKSVNIISVKLVERFGMPVVRSYLQDAGFKQPIDDDAGLTLALGTKVTTILEQAVCYSTLALGGTRVSPTMILEIKDRDGFNRFDYRDFRTKPQLYKRNALPEDAVYVMVNMMEGVCTEDRNRSHYPSGRRTAQLGRPRAGKTGTSNLSKDAWFCGFTPQYTCIVWFGYEDSTPLGDGHAYTGGALASPVWTDFMIKAHEGLPIREFHVPPGVEFYGVHRLTGVAGDDWQAAFIRGTRPRKEMPSLLDLQVGDHLESL